LSSFLNSDDAHITLTESLIRHLSPDSLSIMEFRSELDVTIAEKLLHFPMLGTYIEDKWNISFRQELNMTSDSWLFHKEHELSMLPLYEGKMIHQFTHEAANPRYWLKEEEARKVISRTEIKTGQVLDYERYRLGFRDVAASTNERTMIMTVLP